MFRLSPKRVIKLIAFLSAAGLCAVGQVHAQSTVMFENFLPTMNMTNLQNEVLWKPYQEKSNGPNSSANRNNPAPVVTGNVQLNYTPSLARRKQNLAQFAAKSRAADAAGDDDLARLFASTDLITAMEKALVPYGLRTDNVADAYTAYWISAWLAAHGRIEDNSRAQVQAVKRQAVLALVAIPAIASAPNEKKQEFAEALLIQAALIEGSMAGAKGNPVQLKAVAKAVRQGANASGLDLDAMTLTETGFESVK